MNALIANASLPLNFTTPIGRSVQAGHRSPSYNQNDLMVSPNCAFACSYNLPMISSITSLLSSDNREVIDEIMGKLYEQAKAQFGDTIKSFWLYEGDLCPACTERPIGVVKFKGRDALAINAFIYRERGVLIGYFLCESCAKYIFKEAQKNPYRQTPKHAH